MIYAALKSDLTIYPPAIRRALRYLMEHDTAAMEPGRYAIEGDSMFAVVVDVDLSETEQIRPEAHRTYIDVQFWPEAPVRFGCFPLSEASRMTEARPDSDVWYYQGEPDEAFITGRPGSFAVFFPWDVHRPDLLIGAPGRIRKCVVKVAMALLEEER